jgi:hypothetical protein
MAKRRKITRKRDTVEAITRPERIRRYQYYFLIVCEDEKTEPAYFAQFKPHFPNRSMYIECIGTGRDPLGVVEKSIEERHILQEKTRRSIDFTWAVFDKDDADISDGRIARFNRAYELADEENIKISLSNEVFELWLLLHLETVNGSKPIPRQNIYERLGLYFETNKIYLSKNNEFEYRHGDNKIVAAIAEAGSEDLAISQAAKLRERFVNSKPLDSNPSTDVDLLVIELREWIKFFQY